MVAGVCVNTGPLKGVGKCLYKGKVNMGPFTRLDTL